MSLALRIEYAHERRIRERNKRYYRALHWPIWIGVFFIAPGPLTFSLFAHGFSRANATWLLLVLAATGLAGLCGQLPGVEPRPYILRFCEDKPNPLYRRVCYTVAWNALLNFMLLNIAGLAVAVAARVWRLKQIYDRFYFPLAVAMLCLGALGLLPRARRSTQGEGTERRYFYTAVWTVTAAQTALLILWKTLPRTHATDILKLAIFLAVLASLGTAGLLGLLPRTRPILPGEVIVAD